MEHPAGASCSMCGRSASEHEKHVRFRLPDPVLESPEEHLVAGAWLSHGDPNTSVMMQVPALGPFVRALLPISLARGYKVTFGVWVSISHDELQRAFSVWWEPEYVDLRLTGYLANAVNPWGMLGAPVDLAVRDTEQTPYCVSSPRQDFSDVLHNEWPHAILDEIS